MVSLTETQKSIIDIINEVRRKLGYNTITSLDADAQSRVLVEFLNDTIAEISDYGDWQEMLSKTLIPVSSSVQTYVVSATNPVKNIREIAFTGQIAPLRRRTIEELRLWERNGGRGVPRNYSIFGTDGTTSGNPVVSVYPIPSSAQESQSLDVLYYRKPALYTTSTTATELVPFPSRMVVKGLQAKAYQDETALQQDFAIVRQEFLQMLSETYNRYNGDTGNNTQFTPSRYR